MIRKRMLNMLKSIHSSTRGTTISILVSIAAIAGSVLISRAGQNSSPFQSSADCEVPVGKLKFDRCSVLAQNDGSDRLQNQSGKSSNELTPEEIKEFENRSGRVLPVEVLKDPKKIREVREYLDSKQPYSLFSNKLDPQDRSINTMPGESTEELRNQPGKAFGGDNLRNVTRLIPDKRVGLIPGQIVRQMEGRDFGSFTEFRRTFWKLVAKDPDLKKGWSKANIKLMQKGLAPFAPANEQVGNRKVYELDHSHDLQFGGKVYDLDSIRIVSPRFHDEYGKDKEDGKYWERGSSEGTLNKLLSGNNDPEIKDRATNSAPGGIDFSTLELRYISEDSSLFKDGNIKYSFDAKPTASNKNISDKSIAAVQASDAFFVWLSLSPKKFWVNLNPNEPNRIIDPKLEKTDVGRILLQSDLQMKKTVAKLTHPNTSSGKQYWKQVKSISQRSNCPPMIRSWIVPAPATVREDGNSMYIADAPLDVKLEIKRDAESKLYVSSKYKAKGYGSCTPLSEKQETLHESLERRLILPQIVRAVNTAPEYAELRRVYRSRVAAEWYRQRSASKATAYANLIDRGDVSSWPARQNWSSRQVFNQYVKSLNKGEYRVTHEWRQGNMLYGETYVMGGVDFSRILFKQLSATEFQKKWGNLGQVVDTSMKSPVTNQDGKIWLGGNTITGRATWTIWKSIWIWVSVYVGFLAILLFICNKRSPRKE